MYTTALQCSLRVSSLVCVTNLPFFTAVMEEVSAMGLQRLQHNGSIRDRRPPIHVSQCSTSAQTALVLQEVVTLGGDCMRYAWHSTCSVFKSLQPCNT